MVTFETAAYVNGQRQGKIMEKPFRIGESITKETVVNGNLPSAMPLLDVEGELDLAFKSAGDFEENKVAQKMKELGLERLDFLT